MKLCGEFLRWPPGVAVEQPEPPLRRGAGAACRESLAHLLYISAHRINQAAALQCFPRGVRDQGWERDRAFSGNRSPAVSTLLPQAQSKHCSIKGSRASHPPWPGVLPVFQSFRIPSAGEERGGVKRRRPLMQRERTFFSPLSSCRPHPCQQPMPPEAKRGSPPACTWTRTAHQ